MRLGIVTTHDGDEMPIVACHGFKSWLMVVSTLKRFIKRTVDKPWTAVIVSPGDVNAQFSPSNYLLKKN